MMDQSNHVLFNLLNMHVNKISGIETGLIFCGRTQVKNVFEHIFCIFLFLLKQNIYFWR
jgi:hypothetical protein